MDRMLEHLDKQMDHLNMVERRVSEEKDKQVTMSASQKQVEKVLTAHFVTTQSGEFGKLLTPCQSTYCRTGPIYKCGQYEEVHLATPYRSPTAEPFSEMFVVKHGHHILAACPVPGARPRLIIARLLNYSDRDVALLWSRELQILHHKGTEISTFPDFMQQVQKGWRQLLPGKHKLQGLLLEYTMIYPAHLQVMVAGKAKIFNDP
ncbi:hypothetical protein NDU88_004189 [Pleurodeles waltl]|uniref:Uncharacterized protein n=1 Tax=Pleurodeles waltl TaxID=8319 RepID=A0AAV7WR59_PLEWA|nr:hypothetical protein NDU88_004189 [Pleurodeles waltl]